MIYGTNLALPTPNKAAQESSETTILMNIRVSPLQGNDVYALVRSSPSIRPLNFGSLDVEVFNPTASMCREQQWKAPSITYKDNISILNDQLNSRTTTNPYPCSILSGAYPAWPFASHPICSLYGPGTWLRDSCGIMTLLCSLGGQYSCHGPICFALSVLLMVGSDSQVVQLVRTLSSHLR